MEFKFCAWLNYRRVKGYAICIAAVFAVAMIWFTYDAIYLRGSDFQAFWSAARILITEGAGHVYDLKAQKSIQEGMPTDGYIAFVHPPPFLLFIAPLGLLPYFWAFIAWNVVTFSAWVVAASFIDRRAFWPIVAFPASLLALAHAQTGLLCGALICASVAAGPRRPYLSGMFIGALVLKPQIAMLLPLAILFARETRIFISAGLSAAGLLLLSWMVFGLNAYASFFDNLSVTATLIAEGEEVFLQRMSTVYAAVRLLASEPIAIFVQIVSAVISVFALYIVSRRTNSYFAIISAALASTCLTLPYMFSYDLPFLIVPCIWLGVQGHNQGWLTWEKLGLAASYWGVLVCRALAIPIGINLTPLVAALLLGLIVRRLHHSANEQCVITKDL